MNTIGRSCRALVVLTVILLGLSVLPLASSAQPGNSGAAKQCQHGAWASLARAEDPATPFANQDECVSYAAQGGMLADLEPGTISLSWVYTTQHFGYPQYEICHAQVTLTNFPAGNHAVQLTLDSCIASNGVVDLTVPVGIDGTGTADTGDANGVGVLGAWYASTEPGDDNIAGWQAVVTATTGDGLSTTSSASCQRPA